MPRRQTEQEDMYTLPQGWDTQLDYDGKVIYVDHSTRQTSWINPVDRFTKPATFADCVGDELPYGWEEMRDHQIGSYYINHMIQATQIEDPRQQWREQQETMLKDYLAHAHEDLSAKREIYDVKQERLTIAQDEVKNLDMDILHLKTSRTSLNSAVSTSSMSSNASKVDPDLLRADVDLHKNRVSRLKREIAQISSNMKYQEKGIETLTQVNHKMSTQHSVYTADEALDILSRTRENQRSIRITQQARSELIATLARLKDDVLVTRQPCGSSPDVSTLSLPQERIDTESQTDLSGDCPVDETQWGEVVRIKLKYDEARQQVSRLSEQLASVEGQMMPGQAESDKDRLLLISEKEQLLRELRSIKPKGHTEAEVQHNRQRIHQLELDLKAASELSNKQIAERLKLDESKSMLLKRLMEATKLTTYLESQLKSLSLSTLSVSSGSSRGSLGSLSASSKGSLTSLSFTDIYSSAGSVLHGSEVNLPDLHRRVEKLLQGHSNISTIQEDVAMTTPPGDHHFTTTSTTGTETVPAASGHVVVHPSAGHVTVEPVPVVKGGGCGVGVSPGSSHTSLTSPPASSPGGAPPPPPPPSYEQHMRQAANSHENLYENLPARVADLSVSPDTTTTTNTTGVNLGGCVGAPARTVSGAVRVSASPLPLPSSSSSSSPSSGTAPLTRRTLCAAESGGSDSTTGQPPLSPISESSSGVCNNSGMNTRSVSAAVSDESVAGDSGVFEASMKKPGELDEVFEMSLECAQVQIKLKYESDESVLSITVEQARNLAALAFPTHAQCQVCIKAALIPSTDNLSLQTPAAKDLNNPKFHQIFRVHLEEKLLVSKTLQVHVWCVLEKNQEECLGCAQVSLASFDPQKVSSSWYNVLSFKFMQSDSGSSHGNQVSSSSASMNSSRSSLVGHQLGLTTATASLTSSDHVEHLLTESSKRLNKSSQSIDEKASPETARNIRLRSLSFDGPTFRPPHSAMITSVKEESSMSSDESTIISSQTSTLTRNQEPGDMQHGYQGNEEGLSEDDMDGEESQYDEDEITEEEDLSPEGDMIKVVTCDMATNTDPNFKRGSHVKRRTGDVMTSSSIKRSQTFSPVGRPSQDDYICRLNRSDSDSSVKYRHGRGHFQRNATERRSMRHKRQPLPRLSKSHVTHSTSSNKLRTSLDLELDLQASQARLDQLTDEVTRLQHLKRKFEVAKQKGEVEPSWLTNDEQLQMFLTETEKLMKQQEVVPSKLDERADKLMKKATKSAQRRTQSQEVESRNFREKMAFFVNPHMGVPAVPGERIPSSSGETTPTAERRSLSMSGAPANSQTYSVTSPHVQRTYSVTSPSPHVQQTYSVTSPGPHVQQTYSFNDPSPHVRRSHTVAGFADRSPHVRRVRTVHGARDVTPNAK